MKRPLWVGFALCVLVAHGCRQPSVPGTFSVEAKLTGAPAEKVPGGVVTLVPGEKNNVEITVAYKREAGAAAKLKYEVEVEARGELKLSPISATGWKIEENLKPEAVGHTSTKGFIVEVPAMPKSGEQEIVVTITPEPGEQWRSVVKFKVSR